MEILDLTDKIDWNDHDLDQNFALFDDFSNSFNEVEVNGGNGIEINWDKYEVSYDCPMCIRKMLKDACNSSGERMWADHFTPIFNNHTRNNTQQADDNESPPLEHISTCAFYYFQSPVVKFDIEYLDAVVKKERQEHSAQSSQELMDLKSDIKRELKTSDYGSEDSEYPLTPNRDEVLLKDVESMRDLYSAKEEDNLIDVESLDSDVINSYQNKKNIIIDHHNFERASTDLKGILRNSQCLNSTNNVFMDDSFCDKDFPSLNDSFKRDNRKNNLNPTTSFSSSPSSSSSSSDNNNTTFHHPEPISEFHNYCTSSYQQKQQNHHHNQQQQNYKHHYKQQKQKHHNNNGDDDDDEDIEYSPPYYYNRSYHHGSRQLEGSGRGYRCKRPSHMRSPSPSYHPSHPYRHRRGTSARNKKAFLEETSKRAQHNVLERQRRSNLKELFVSLKNHIPSMSVPFSTSKFSKVAILDNACAHVSRLRREENATEQRLAKLKRRFEQLQKSLRS